MAFKYESGIGQVASYLASARPFLSSSINVPSAAAAVVNISFPSVSKFVTVKNMGPTGSDSAPMRFGFSSNGVKGLPNNNYMVLDNGESYTADIRVTNVYLMTDGSGVSNNATGSIVAGMTGIGTRELPNNWSGSSGVG